LVRISEVIGKKQAVFVNTIFDDVFKVLHSVTRYAFYLVEDAQ